VGAHGTDFQAALDGGEPATNSTVAMNGEEQR
jgi:hypothetical protein